MSDINAVTNSIRPGERSIRSLRTVGDSVQQQIKTSVHKELIKRIDLDKLGEMQETRGAQQQLFARDPADHQASRAFR